MTPVCDPGGDLVEGLVVSRGLQLLVSSQDGGHRVVQCFG